MPYIIHHNHSHFRLICLIVFGLVVALIAFHNNLLPRLAMSRSGSCLLLPVPYYIFLSIFHCRSWSIVPKIR